MMNILITGANGFIGKRLADYLLEETSYIPRLAVRTLGDKSFQDKAIAVGDISATTNWQDALNGCNVVVHTAARVHILNDKAVDPLAEFRRVNVEGTVNLARQAASAGVTRFIFISSIKVNGEITRPDKPFNADDTPCPTDAYAISKYEAERALQRIAKESGMEIVIIRPPLVYGPKVKGNFQSMLMWLKKGIPLPLGAINNKRSFVSIDNLVDLIVLCISHHQAKNQILLVSDGEDLSTTELLQKMSHALEKPVHLIPIPSWILKGTARLLGKKGIGQRLCGSLQVDISKTERLLEWKPPIAVDEALLRLTQTK
ncbi:MAG: SDR family oxidoreductase [Legionella sp.]|nr:SDR family oxidoreductase [Legionella sp.]